MLRLPCNPFGRQPGRRLLAKQSGHKAPPTFRRRLVSNPSAGRHVFTAQQIHRGRLEIFRRRQVADVFGIASPEFALGKTDYEFLSRETANALTANDHKVLSTGEPLEVE